MHIWVCGHRWGQAPWYSTKKDQILCSWSYRQLWIIQHGCWDPNSGHLKKQQKLHLSSCNNLLKGNMLTCPALLNRWPAKIMWKAYFLTMGLFMFMKQCAACSKRSALRRSESCGCANGRIVSITKELLRKLLSPGIQHSQHVLEKKRAEIKASANLNSFSK